MKSSRKEPFHSDSQDQKKTGQVTEELKIFSSVQGTWRERKIMWDSDSSMCLNLNSKTITPLPYVSNLMSMMFSFPFIN